MNVAEFRRVFGSIERVEWIKSLPSVASGKRPCVNAHVKNGGTSRKAEYIWIVPLTWHEHQSELHQHGQRTFEKKYGIDLEAEAQRIAKLWESIINGPDWSPPDW